MQCIKLGIRVSPASYLLKEQTIYMWLHYGSVICGVTNLSLHIQLCSVKAEMGWRGVRRGGEKQGERKF